MVGAMEVVLGAVAAIPNVSEMKLGPSAELAGPSPTAPKPPKSRY